MDNTTILYIISWYVILFIGILGVLASLAFFGDWWIDSAATKKAEDERAEREWEEVVKNHEEQWKKLEAGKKAFKEETRQQ